MITKGNSYYLVLLFIFTLISHLNLSQRQPGDIFREYVYGPDIVAESEHFFGLVESLTTKFNFLNHNL